MKRVLVTLTLVVATLGLSTEDAAGAGNRGLQGHVEDRSVNVWLNRLSPDRSPERPASNRPAASGPEYLAVSYGGPAGARQPAPLADVGPQWSVDTPLRRDWERRQALVELDALAAVMLDITAEELCAIYRTQFGVLRKYERANRYDANGRKVPPDVVKAYEAWQERGGRSPDLGRYEPPFVGYDREADLTRAHADFSRRLALRPGR